VNPSIDGAAILEGLLTFLNPFPATVFFLIVNNLSFHSITIYRVERPGSGLVLYSADVNGDIRDG
jgi:hypothetical protein